MRWNACALMLLCGLLAWGCDNAMVGGDKEICDNNIDDDDDNQTDCGDEDCSDYPVCVENCGNGKMDAGEKCDTAITTGEGVCPAVADCDDSLSCTRDTVTGEACLAYCAHSDITQPANDDGCCPLGATASNDNDCPDNCGNDRCDDDEDCENCPTDCGDCCQDGCPMVGATECADGKIRSCESDAQGCLVWGTTTDCPQGSCANDISCEACGAGGQACCELNRCNGSGCCVGNRCVAAGEKCGDLDATCQAGVCVDGGGDPCGGDGQPCCEGVTCTEPETMCFQGSCGPCGHLGEACCGGACVGDSLICDTDGGSPGICVSCGGADQECCQGNRCDAGGCCLRGNCVANGAVCLQDEFGTCDNGTCTDCGTLTKPCCERSECTEVGTICTTGTCQSCGGDGERCCGWDMGNTGCDPGLICPPITQFEEYPCTPCGGDGQLCCSGYTCSDGGCCFRGLCVGDGNLCETPSGDTGTCQDGWCSGCGSPGLPCCPSTDGARCQSGSICPPGPEGPDLLCQVCGNAGQLCCPGNGCSGELCCNVEQNCIASGTECGGGGGVCDAGTCGSCGGLGQPCCENPGRLDWCSQSDTMCAGGLCMACGNLGDYCCYDGLRGSTCNDGLMCIFAVGSPKCW